jgi:hypothetical protein
MRRQEALTYRVAPDGHDDKPGMFGVPWIRGTWLAPEDLPPADSNS